MRFILFIFCHKKFKNNQPSIPNADILTIKIYSKRERGGKESASFKVHFNSVIY